MKKRRFKFISYVTAIAMLITVFNIPLLSYAAEPTQAGQNGFGVAMDDRVSDNYVPVTTEGVVVEDLLDVNLDPYGEGPNNEFEITYDDGIFDEDPDNPGQEMEDAVPEGLITITSSDADVVAPILQKRVYNEETNDYDYIYQNDIEAISKLDVDDDGFVAQYFSLFYTGLGRADITMTFTYPDGEEVVMAEFPVIVKGVMVYVDEDSFIYDGKVHKPEISVEDWEGNVISEEYYTVKYPAGCKMPGEYYVEIIFDPDCAVYQGTLYVGFIISPKAPASVSTRLTGHDDIRVSWSKSTGADGYFLYYKKGTGDYEYLKKTTGTYTTVKNLSDGAKYYFKVVPYIDAAGHLVPSTASKTSSYIYTLKKVSTPKVTKSGTKVKVSWTNISGETGYQISKSTSKSKTNIVGTYKGADLKSKIIKATKGKKYYYKVRAYKTYKVNGETIKVYGPWSTPKAYKR